MAKNDFRIDIEFKRHLRKLTKAEREKLKAKIQHEGCRDEALVVADIGGDRVLIDGHNTLEICDELNVPTGRVRCIQLPTRDAALEWMEWNQEGRRNASVEEMAAARAARIGRVVEARKEGQSTRVIAEQEGISHEQVRRDLQKAQESGVTPVTPEQRTQEVQGKDGKTYPATKAPSQFCSRCQRVGPAKDCPACKDLKSAGKPGGKSSAPSSNGTPTKPKPGSVKYDWNASDKQFGAVARWPDAVASAYPGEKQSEEYKRLIDLLTEVAEVRTKWHKRLKKIKGAA